MNARLDSRALELADAGAPVAAEHAAACPASGARRRRRAGRTRRRRRPRGRGRAPRSGRRTTVPSTLRVRWTPRNGQRGVGHRVDQPADEVRAVGAQLPVLAAERDDPRARPARPRRARGGPPAARRTRSPGRPRRVAVGELDRRPRRPSCRHARDLGARSGPRRRRARTLGGERARRPRRSRRSRSSGECSAATPRACGSTSRSSLAVEPPQPGHAVRGARSLERGAARPARSRRSRRRACRTRRTASPCSAQ